MQVDAEIIVTFEGTTGKGRGYFKTRGLIFNERMRSLLKLGKSWSCLDSVAIIASVGSEEM